MRRNSAAAGEPVWGLQERGALSKGPFGGLRLAFPRPHFPEGLLRKWQLDQLSLAADDLVGKGVYVDFFGVEQLVQRLHALRELRHLHADGYSLVAIQRNLALLSVAKLG